MGYDKYLQLKYTAKYVNAFRNYLYMTSPQHKSKRKKKIPVLHQVGAVFIST